MAGIGNTLMMVVFDPARFGGVEHFLEQTTGLTTFVRSCPTKSGVNSITLPGDPERAMRAKRTIDGVAIPDGTWALITKEAERLGVAM